MKNLILFICALLILSCNKKEKKYSPEIEAKAKAMVDSTINAIKVENIEKESKDSTGMKNSPVQILKSRLVDVEYSNYRDIELKYKNVSDKTITAIRFEWYGKNAFGEPADMGSVYSEGRGGGFTDEKLKPGKVSYGTWNIYSNDAKTITIARAYEVVFSDGTKWKLK